MYTETKQLEESPINDGNPVDAVLNDSNESSDDVNETYAGRDSTGSDVDVEECDEELPPNETTNADAGILLADENSDRTFTDPDNTEFDELPLLELVPELELGLVPGPGPEPLPGLEPWPGPAAGSRS